MAGIYLFSDWSDIDAELERLGRLPGPAAERALDAALEELFGYSQLVVHVRTASLQGSGKTDSSVDRIRHTWSGEITYGGESDGVNNPVDYAWYEQRRDDAHDFMKPVQMRSDQVMGDALLDILR